MQARRRSFIVGLSLLVMASGGVAAMVANPAGADEGELVCTVVPSGSGAPLDDCTVSDPDGIRTILVVNTETDQQQTSSVFSCANPLTSFGFKVPAGTRYKVFVNDCSVPRVKTSYVIRPNGTVVQPTASTSTSSSTTTTSLPPSVTTPDIFLGYADTLHGTNPGTQFVPDPWQDDPGVVFLGCTVPSLECGTAYDGGAIRVDNPLTNPALTLVDAYVDITASSGTCHFRTWDGFLSDPTANKTVAPGGKLILTQTGLLGPPQAPPCDGRVELSERPITNFDTSEGPLDTIDPPFSNCNFDDSIVSPPVVTLVFDNGMTLTIVDNPDPVVQNDEILNTGGTDRFACQGLEEATPWTAVPSANVVRTP